MPAKFLFLSIRQIDLLHLEVLKEFGGADGLRDRGLLESALEMPRATFDGKLLHKNLSAIAAAYLFHICRNHPFIDGNKRVALGAALIFIEVNGGTIRASDDELERLTLGVASSEINKDAVTTFFRRRVKARR